MSRPLRAPHLTRGSLLRWSGALLVLGVGTATASAAVAGPIGSATGVASAVSPSAPTVAQGLKTVRYRGVSVRVPAGWPLVDLDADPTACVRLDREAVYVGTPAAQQDCPAHAVGRADTVWLAPAGPRERSLAAIGRTESLGGLAARVVDVGVGQERQVVLPDEGVVVRTAWGTDPTATQQAVTSIAPAVGPVAVAAAGPLPDPAATVGSAGPASAAVSAASTTTALATASAGSVLTGMAFDTCAAPSTGSMSAWRKSPYAAVGIYIGGSMRACGDGNLSASWVSTVTSGGWGLIPIYVGPQAPCVGQSGLAHISPTQAAAQGKANAADAIVQAKRFGLGAGTIVYYDMESYATGNASCTSTVLTFVTAWTAELHRQGYLSGVYGNPGSLMSDMSRAVTARSASFTPPDQVWYAHWNQLQNTTDASSYPVFKDSYWTLHQRLHQYSGGATQTWGGVAINIDANWVDARLPGNPVQVGYGTNNLGPGSAGFVFTGAMTYWRPSSSGVTGRAYWTHPNSTAVENNGATWQPSLSTALYGVDAYVPTTSNAGVAKYTMADSRGVGSTSVDQSAASGYRRIGTVLKQPGSSVVVHLGDNAGSATTKLLWADAMRFTVLATVPGAPTSVSSAPSDGRADVTWAAPPANGSAITGYTLTASPGGATVSVGGDTTTAMMTGLTNGTAYTFSVTATNVVGTGPASAASAPATPVVAGRFVAQTPVRVLDTRVGTTANPGLKTALKAHQRVGIKVAGVSGSPVPAGATAVVVNLTVTGSTTAGHIDPSSGGSSLVNFAARQTIANLATLRLAADGTVSLLNGSSGAVHLVADVEGYVTPTIEGGLWVATTPTRLLDTRSGTTTNARSAALGAGESVTVQVAQAAGSPVGAGAIAAALRVTATDSQWAGFLTASDGGGARTSTVNYGRGQVVGNLALVPLSGTGSVVITNHSAGSVQVVVDLQGQVTASGSLWTPLAPGRILDTRTGTSANPGAVILAAGATRVVKVAGVPGSPVPAGAVAAAVNLTVVPTTAPGWVSVAASGTTPTSALNFARGTIVANLAITPLAPDGTMVVHNGSSKPVQLVIDVQGYAAPAAG